MWEKEEEKRHNICNITFAGHQHFMDIISKCASNAEQEITLEKA